jgi:2-hydroxychromene-2-carboxylate isomerase
LRPLKAEVLLYVDPQSPYSWLAHARAPQVLGVTPQLRPITLAPIFARRGWGSWWRTEEREAGQREVERRAVAYGLGEVRWPDGWPLDSLRPSRALTLARMYGRGDAFFTALGAATFTRGEDPADAAVLAAAAAQAGLDPEVLEDRIADPAVKAALREATDTGWDAGVRGAPTVSVNGTLIFGDDRLEEAASLLRSDHSTGGSS